MKYTIRTNALDMQAAYENESNKAEQDGLFGLAARQRGMALHIRNAAAHLQHYCPEGMRVDVEVVFKHVPAVNPVLSDRFWQERQNKS